ncbi:UPF0481 protein At3g47200-like [Quercus robur]|uniref:UPF0481 protein At3g47200-like n=1 Tax=Quercus robur TaxID=38942 RepID=UPI002163DFAA|nr:UPF0481 protein At3g47200-like [Quercus robur]XP_050273045.1 UPF0481 protein At3g47200-like [Quercus robur]XP_050273046.1 UPF0481 protein At3g47200-like [Quercus robur]
MEGAVGIGNHQGSNASTEIGSENTENQKEANTSNEKKIQNERLVDDLKLMIKEPVPPLSIEGHIRRIPDHLRQVKEKAYTPTTISIGPIHHCKNKFQIMETCKVRYFKSFISRTRINSENLVSTISDMEERIRSFYVVATLPSRHEFVKMILVDAVFILELFYRDSKEDKDMNDLILTGQSWPIKCDLMLLENQIPFFVFEKLSDLIPCPSNSYPFIRLTFSFFNYFNVEKIIDPIGEIKHFTDLIRTFQIPQLIFLPARRSTEKFTLSFSATQLHEAGVKFKVSSSKCLADITFEFANGVLEIPCLELYDGTETLIRNVMALEQYCYPTNRYVTDYFGFLDDLINTTEDMDLLCNNKIVIHHLGENNAATSFFNNLNTNITIPGFYSNYNDICQNLNKFCEKPWHKWRAMLRHQYFSTPWRAASTIAAIILLVFTFIQTVCSIIQIVPIV